MRGHKWLNIFIFIGLIAGVIVGYLLLRHYEGLNLDAAQIAERINWLSSLGDLILIRPLKMLIIPLVFASVVVGITSIGDPSRLGLVGTTTIVYYFATMFVAVVLGAALVSTLRPGDGVSNKIDLKQVQEAYETSDDSPRGKIENAPTDLGGAWGNILRQAIPDNVLGAAVSGQPLPIITFAILFGMALGFLGEKARPAIDFFEAFFQAIMTLVGWVLWLTPIGVFLLVTWTLATLGGQAISAVGKYMLIVVAGLFIHGFITLPLVLFLFGQTNPYRFMWRMRPALITAFGTDSSSATLPVTIRTCENEGECSKRACGFVLPLGATINMDGTALYEAVAALFIAQAYGIHLSFAAQLLVVVTATLAAIGAAGIPSAGLVMMLTILTTLGLPVEGAALILAVDRPLDMLRTVVNVWSDSCGAAVIAASEGELDFGGVTPAPR